MRVVGDMRYVPFLFMGSDFSIMYILCYQPVRNMCCTVPIKNRTEVSIYTQILFSFVENQGRISYPH